MNKYFIKCKGGINGIKGLATGKLKIKGDLVIASEVASIFVAAGGPERVIKYLEKHNKQRKPRQTKKESEHATPLSKVTVDKLEKFSVIKSKL